MKKSAVTSSTRLTSITYVIPLLIIGLISVYFALSSIYHSNKSERTNFLSKIRSLTDEAKLELQIDIVKSFDAAINLSRNEALIRWFSGNSGELEKELALAVLANLMGDNRYDQAYAASRDQQIYYLGNGQREVLTPGDPDDSWFYNSLEMEKKAEIKIDHNKDIGRTLLWVNVKVEHEGEVLGVAGLGMSLERIQEKLSQLIPGQEGAILFADEKGSVRLSFPPELNNHTLKEILRNPRYRFIDLTESSEFSLKRTESIYTVSPITDLNLSMVLMLSLSDYFSPYMSPTGLYSLISIVLMVLLIIVFLAVFQKLRTTIINLDKSQDMTIHSMSMLAELKDNETGTHITRTRIYCRLLSEELNRSSSYKKYLTKTYINDLEKSAPLHDVGKVGIPDSILHKPGKLTAEEFEVIKSHPVLGANVLHEAMESHQFQSYFTIGVQLVRHHHERWDGTGYPDGLKGYQIPLSARIMAIADVYDALRSTRPYKESFSHEKSISIIKEGSGTHFEPELVSALLRKEKDFKAVSVIYTDT